MAIAFNMCRISRLPREIPLAPMEQLMIINIPIFGSIVNTVFKWNAVHWNSIRYSFEYFNVMLHNIPLSSIFHMNLVNFKMIHISCDK